MCSCPSELPRVHTAATVRCYCTILDVMPLPIDCLYRSMPNPPCPLPPWSFCSCLKRMMKGEPVFAAQS